jgi:tetratricopeptide (TPR) repeat protein
MRKSTVESLLKLPQSTDTWYLGSRQLRLWIAPEDQDPYRPYLLLLFNLDQGLIINFELVDQMPTERELENFIAASMRKKQEDNGIYPQRPAYLFFENNKMMQELRPALNAVEVQVKFRPQTELLNDIVRSLEQHMREDEPEIPGLLSIPGVKPKEIAALFEAAVQFYKAAPWVSLTNDDVLAVRVPPQSEPWYVIVMGHGGVEYGLALYKTWEDVKLAYLPKDRPDDWVPPSGANSFLFNPATYIPYDDLDAIQKYGWEVEDYQAIPSPMIFMPPDRVERPKRDEILWYEAVLRAIPVFEKEHLKTDVRGNRIPSEAEIAVQTLRGATTVEIKTPAGDLPKTGVWVPNLDEFGESQETKLPFDRRIIEKDLSQISMPGEIEKNRDIKLIEAQEMIYQAWEENNPAKRIILAHSALKISPNCADAYVLLAEEEADSPERALQLYQSGIQAGKRALGENYFEENKGYFWGLLETRPYMRALEGVARCLWILGNKDESIRNYQKLLELNPNDNQGIRYVLADLYQGYRADKELEQLIRQFENDWTAVWLYTRALLAYKKSGENNEANRILSDAMGQNPFVPEYLTGKKRVPVRIPETMGWGDESEAVRYASDHLNYWREVPGAIDWVERRYQEESPIASSSYQRANPAFREWEDKISKKNSEIAENLALRKDVITLITYLREQRVVGTRTTGNFPLKAVREITSRFVHPPQLEKVLGDYTHRIRSEYDVWSLYFLHVLVDVAGLIEGGHSKRWRITSEGEKFLSQPAHMQVQRLLATWWNEVNWLIAFDYVGLGSELPQHFEWNTLQFLLKQPVKKAIDFEPFADQLIEAGQLVWHSESQEFDRIPLRAAIERMVIKPLVEFGVLETQYKATVLGDFEFKNLVSLRITGFGKKLLETLW